MTSTWPWLGLMLATLTILLGNGLADLTHLWLDPRIRSR